MLLEADPGEGRGGFELCPQYQNPELDELLEVGVTQTEPAERKEIYAKVQQILLDEVPFRLGAARWRATSTRRGSPASSPISM